MLINKVYHWSPTTNRKDILQKGLLILNSFIKYKNTVTKKDEIWNCPYICASLEPRTAYIYVPPMFANDGEIPSLDLYEVDIKDTDEIILRNDNTNEIIEVRICNSIPGDRVHYIATRSEPVNK
jgi:hypothetical protein